MDVAELRPGDDFNKLPNSYVISTRDESITELHRKITELKKSREWEAGYMKLEELFEKKKREGIEQGKHIALVASISDFLSDKGDLSAELKERIEAENDITKLNEWIKLAVKTETIEEFEKNM